VRFKAMDMKMSLFWDITHVTRSSSTVALEEQVGSIIWDEE
jgi:hypothetical protein